jgi:hypothetical protein
MHARKAALGLLNNHTTQRVSAPKQHSNVNSVCGRQYNAILALTSKHAESSAACLAGSTLALQTYLHKLYSPVHNTKLQVLHSNPTDSTISIVLPN